jgi:hypothetical protein
MFQSTMEGEKTMPEKLTAEEIETLNEKFRTNWRKFRKALKDKDFEDIPINDQATLVHRVGSKKHVVHGRAKIIDYIKNHMPGLAVVQTDETPPERAMIMTWSIHEVKAKKTDVYVTHDAVKVTFGTFTYNPEGDYTMTWIHQDECFWELGGAEFRGR